MERCSISLSMGYPCHFSSSFPPFQTSTIHFPLIGECEFCHHLINVPVSTLSASSAPAGTSVHAHLPSHRGVSGGAASHAPSALRTCGLLSLWLLKAKLDRLWSHSEGERPSRGDWWHSGWCWEVWKDPDEWRGEENWLKGDGKRCEGVRRGVEGVGNEL